jgi:hypothetical protein
MEVARDEADMPRFRCAFSEAMLVLMVEAIWKAPWD